MSSRGFILPIFFVFTISFVLTSSFLLRDFYRIFRISGFYRAYLKDDLTLGSKLAELNFKKNHCYKINNREICALNNQSNINYSFLSNSAKEKLICSNDFILDNYIGRNIFSSYSLKSTKLCTQGLIISNSTKIIGNLLSNQPINVNTKSLYINGFLYSSLILHNNHTEIMALGDVNLDRVDCNQNTDCYLYIASLSGNVAINSISDKINLNIYAKDKVYSNYYYNYWNALEIKELGKLPISINF
jgi:hypothetical protein